MVRVWSGDEYERVCVCVGVVYFVVFDELCDDGSVRHGEQFAADLVHLAVQQLARADVRGD